MIIDIIEVKNCKYVKEDNSLIDCEACFSHLFNVDGEGVKTYLWVPFTADPNDPEPHGRLLYANAIKGDYGSVSAFAHPTLEIQMVTLRNNRNHLLFETDWTQTADVPQATKDKYTTYRQELRDLTTGLDTAAKARAVTWPTKPS